MGDQWRVARLPQDLCVAVEQRMGQNFGSLDELLTFVLEELLREDAAELDQAEERLVAQRLRELGYI